MAKEGAQPAVSSVEREGIHRFVILSAAKNLNLSFPQKREFTFLTSNYGF
jgi:hypothetical protein